MASTRWPSRLWIVRHGESAGNVARDAAHAQRCASASARPCATSTSRCRRAGEEQATALGRLVRATWRADERPEVLLVSPYVRAQETARLFRDGGRRRRRRADLRRRAAAREGVRHPRRADDRAASRASYPDQAEFRRLLGKFYHRPPGGESWCDVIFRLRSVMDTIALHYAGRRVMIVAHQVVVLCLRYIIERLAEEQILAIDREGDVANCSITEYRFDPPIGRRRRAGAGPLQCVTAPVEQTARPTVTAEPERTQRSARMSDAHDPASTAAGSRATRCRSTARAPTKNSRGRVLAIGGSRTVPGALRLTGEAALRAGAGKLQMATIASAAHGARRARARGGVIALPEDDDGEIVADARTRLRKPLRRVRRDGASDPASATSDAAGGAAAAACCARPATSDDRDRCRGDRRALSRLPRRVGALRGRLIITPHHGEMAALTGARRGRDRDDPAARRARGRRTIWRRRRAEGQRHGHRRSRRRAAPLCAAAASGWRPADRATCWRARSPGCCRAARAPLVAAGWGVWLHGQGGRRVATTSGPIGFLARELPGEFPRLVATVGRPAAQAREQRGDASFHRPRAPKRAGRYKQPDNLRCRGWFPWRPADGGKGGGRAMG